MKKKLEAELISLAHRILQLKNKSEIGVLHEEARRLYEKLSVLRFVEENFAGAKPTIGQPEIEDKLEKAFDYDAKVVVGEVPGESETDVAAATEISAMVKNLAASKTVTGEPAAETAEKEEPAAEADAPEEVETEAGPETPEEEQEPGKNAEETSEENQPEEAETAEAPTFEEGTQFEQPEAVEEIKLAEEANKASEFFWEAKPDDAPAENTSDSEPAQESNTEAPEGSKQDDLFAPKFELAFDAREDDIKKPDEPSPTFTFDDLLGKDYADPVFVKREDFDKPAAPAGHNDEPAAEEPKKEVIPITRSFDTSNVIPINKDENRAISLNERLSKGITIGLNDRIAFMKNLFNNSSEDYNRVLSQLITFDTYGDAKNFIDNMVKPDYNNWDGKEEYEQRFMEIVEKRFT